MSLEQLDDFSASKLQFHTRRFLLRRQLARCRSSQYPPGDPLFGEQPAPRTLQLVQTHFPSEMESREHKLAYLLTEILPFVDSWNGFLNFRLTSKAMFVLSSKPELLEMHLETVAPRLLREVSSSRPTESIHCAALAYTRFFRKQEVFLTGLKAKANGLYEQNKVGDALKHYEHLLSYLVDMQMAFDDQCLPRLKVPLALKTAIFKIFLTSMANKSQCHLVLGHPMKSFRACKRAMDIHAYIIHENDHRDSVMDELKTVYNKIMMRLKAAKLYIRQISVFRFSTENYPELRLGSILHAAPHLRGSIFHHAVIVITKFERGHGCEGLIVNRRQTDPATGEMVQVGGPCEVDTRFYLHDVADAPGAVLVRPGVYFRGEVQGLVGNPAHRVLAVKGKSGWFEGQLDGELFNDDWTLTNDMTADSIFGQEVIG